MPRSVDERPHRSERLPLYALAAEQLRSQSEENFAALNESISLQIAPRKRAEQG